MGRIDYAVLVLGYCYMCVRACDLHLRMYLAIKCRELLKLLAISVFRVFYIHSPDLLMMCRLLQLVLSKDSLTPLRSKRAWDRY